MYSFVIFCIISYSMQCVSAQSLGTPGIITTGLTLPYTPGMPNGLVGPGINQVSGIASNHGMPGLGLGPNLGMGPNIGLPGPGMGSNHGMGPNIGMPGPGMGSNHGMGPNIGMPGSGMGSNYGMGPNIGMPGSGLNMMPNPGMAQINAQNMANGNIAYGKAPPPAYPAGYGGSGSGDVAVAGELPVAGMTAVNGQVPITGAVQFGGNLPAGGTVTITGMCGCGCNGPSPNVPSFSPYY